ncbi:MAG: hypothetical protein A2W99_12550 [Bacteroidetes bacterium GWF2_33_16]|nr:MAG: hypothetical protein A2X00_01725 [Bacteroidetes bacterium GWE2_32_14]OFY06740.1 MAG: hypothetical protein A2W99_12550 [Bacteroidetes bacterium GWF2_33_16]
MLNNSISKIPFEYRLGLPIIKVSINGKSYDFLFDTGAINVISEELSKIPGINTSFIKIVRDSQGAKSKLKSVKIDSILIGNAAFSNISAVVADLSKSVEISCLHIDGIIGSDLMKLAIWQIDYENQLITCTKDKSLLEIPKKHNTIKFKTTSTGKQYVDIILENQVEKSLTFDTGSNGGYSCSKKTYKKLVKNNSILIKNLGYGSKNSGLYGRENPDTTFYVLINDFEIGNLALKNIPVQFKQNGSRTIGNEFLKNYRVIIDWKAREIILIPNHNKEYDFSRWKSFGFSPYLEDNKFFVGFIVKGSSADEQGLKLGDQIIEINSYDYSRVPLEDYCDFISNSIFSESDSISISILRENKVLNMSLFNNPILKNY